MGMEGTYTYFSVLIRLDLPWEELPVEPVLEPVGLLTALAEAGAEVGAWTAAGAAVGAVAGAAAEPLVVLGKLTWSR